MDNSGKVQVFVIFMEVKILQIWKICILLVLHGRLQLYVVQLHEFRMALLRIMHITLTLINVESKLFSCVFGNRNELMLKVQLHCAEMKCNPWKVFSGQVTGVKYGNTGQLFHLLILSIDAQTLCSAWSTSRGRSRNIIVY